MNSFTFLPLILFTFVATLCSSTSFVEAKSTTAVDNSSNFEACGCNKRTTTYQQRPTRR